MPLLTTSRRVAVAKTITWRVLATTTTFVIAAIVTRDIEAAFAIGGAEAIAKMGVYYLHERACTTALGSA